MKLGITPVEKLKEMKEKMDLVWNDLFERSPGKSEEDFQWVAKLPGSEGTGRRSFRSRSDKHIN